MTVSEGQLAVRLALDTANPFPAENKTTAQGRDGLMHIWEARVRHPLYNSEGENCLGQDYHAQNSRALPRF